MAWKITEFAENPYDVLEIPGNASIGEIILAYKQKAKQIHPDVYSGSSANLRMQKLNWAFDGLRDPANRKIVDAIFAWRTKTSYTEPGGGNKPNTAGGQPTYNEAAKNNAETKPPKKKAVLGRSLQLSDLGGLLVLLFLGSCVLETIWPGVILKDPYQQAIEESKRLASFLNPTLIYAEANEFLPEYEFIIENTGEADITCSSITFSVFDVDGEFLGSEYLPNSVQRLGNIFEAREDTPLVFTVLDNEGWSSYTFDFSGCTQPGAGIQSREFAFYDVVVMENSLENFEVSAKILNGSGGNVSQVTTYLYLLDEEGDLSNIKECALTTEFAAGESREIACLVAKNDKTELQVRFVGIGITSTEQYSMQPTSTTIELVPQTQPTAEIGSEFGRCIPWELAYLHDGEEVCVIGKLIAVEIDHDPVCDCDVYTGFFSTDKDISLRLVRVGREIEGLGHCVAVNGKLSDREPLEEYDISPVMVDIEPFDEQGFSVLGAPVELCER